MQENLKFTMDKEFREGERLYLGYGEAAEEKMHKGRYYFARENFNQGSVVLDAASGSGYGSEILSEKAGKVFGLEINPHSLSFARSHYLRSNIEFIQQDLNGKFPFQNEYFDAIVSFETIEHVQNQNSLISEFNRVLKKNGVLVISSPDREVITDKAKTVNKFHIAELSKKEFIELLSRYFLIEKIYGQVKFTPLVWWKKVIKILAKLDILKVKRLITKTFRLQRFVHNSFLVEEGVDMVLVSENEPNDFFHIIVVARKI